jgi:hypothetical protein
MCMRRPRRGRTKLSEVFIVAYRTAVAGRLQSPTAPRGAARSKRFTSLAGSRLATFVSYSMPFSFQVFTRSSAASVGRSLNVTMK